MKLHTLSPSPGSTKNSKRVGRGQGSGRGGTSTRGHKGAKSRSGYSQKRGFEGGQMPLQRRVPKFGFKNPNRVEYKVVNLDKLQSISETLGRTELKVNDFIKLGLLSKKDKLKILGRGELTAALNVEAHSFSNSAKEGIEKAAGTTILL